MNSEYSSFIPSKLILENQITFSGLSPHWQEKHCSGEVVFTTGMTGYPESLTDPSFAGQILTFTYPLIGNYGILDEEKWESSKVQVSGLVVSSLCKTWSHPKGKFSLLHLLQQQNIPIITDVDTRALTKILRNHGSMKGVITDQEKVEINFSQSSSTHLVSKVSIKEPLLTQNGDKKIIVIDCGIKQNILRFLSKYPLTLKQVPYDYDYNNEEWDGIFISNGPGDPQECQKTIEILKKAMKREKPIFGICLGTQLMALAAGAKTYKLPFGHRGHNQPCIDLKTNKCYLTSQNHGYCIDKNSLSEEWEISFKNLNDGSIEGISHCCKPFFSVQFHPEAAPGPTDTQWLFQKFYNQL